MYRPLLHFLPPMPQVKICMFLPVSNHTYSTRPKKSITYTPICRVQSAGTGIKSAEADNRARPERSAGASAS